MGSKNNPIFLKQIWKIINDDNPIFIHPDSTSIHPRLAVIKKFNNSFSLLESIDNKDFYKIARKIDNADLTNITSILLEVFLLIFKKISSFFVFYLHK